MARTLTLGTLVTRCQQRADLENDGHIAASEWKSLVSEAYGELHGITAEAGLRHFETTATIAANGAASYALPADHLATIGIDQVLDSAGRRRPLVELMMQEQPAVVGATGTARYFVIAAGNIELYPVPASGSYKHRYIPQAADYSGSADGTSIDVITPDGEAFVIWAVAVKALAKSESDVQLAIMEREAARERFRSWVQLRSFVTPRRSMMFDDDEVMDPADYRWGR